MYIVIGVNIVNIVGDLLLVPGTWGLPSFGVVGAAWASVVAQAFGLGGGRGHRLAARARLLGLGLAAALAGAALAAVFRRADPLFRAHAGAGAHLRRGDVAGGPAGVRHHAGGPRHPDAAVAAGQPRRGRLRLRHGDHGGHVAGPGRSSSGPAPAARPRWSGASASAPSSAPRYLLFVDGVAAFFTHNEDVIAVVVSLGWAVALSQPVNAAAYVFDGILIGGDGHPLPPQRHAAEHRRLRGHHRRRLADGRAFPPTYLVGAARLHGHARQDAGAALPLRRLDGPSAASIPWPAPNRRPRADSRIARPAVRRAHPSSRSNKRTFFSPTRGGGS